MNALRVQVDKRWDSFDCSLQCFVNHSGAIHLLPAPDYDDKILKTETMWTGVGVAFSSDSKTFCVFTNITVYIENIFFQNH
jgi:hypothetical protein